MTVKTYVHRDSAGRPWPPAFQHETSALIDIVKRMWAAFHHQPATYALVGNVHHHGLATADLVVVGENGLGVVEMKNRPGVIAMALKPHLARQPGNGGPASAAARDLAAFDWLAGGDTIDCGRHANPQEQVQSYVAGIRQALLERKPGWLALEERSERSLRIQSAVCFTHVDAQIDGLKADLARRLDYAQQRDFTVLLPQDVPQWASTLRFEMAHGEEAGYEPVSLFPAEVEQVATEVLGATEWVEIANLMPTGEPYGLLRLIENGQAQMVFRLDRDDILVGRDPAACHVVIPSQYTRVSKQHLHLWRTADGLMIEDLGSRNGTFVQWDQQPKQQLLRRMPLVPGQQIFLGGPIAGEAVCLLEFLPTIDAPAEATEVAFWVRLDDRGP